MKRFGASNKTRKQWTRSSKNQPINSDQPFGVFPANWDAVMLFLRLSNCPVYAGMNGTLVGLDHAEFWRVLAAMRNDKQMLYAEQSDLALYDQFQLLSHSYLEAWHES